MPKIAADTNIFIRLLVKDDAEQVQRARRLFADDEEIVVRATVLVEIEWVLRGVFGFDRARINKALAEILALPNLILPDENSILLAIQWHAAGMDFADAVHLAGSADCDEFVTFDRDLVRKAKAANDAIPVRLL